MLLCTCGVVAYLGYNGFVPGVSSLFGANTPKDLGVTYTELDYESYMDKTGSTITVLPIATEAPAPQESITFADPVDHAITFTESEITARVNTIQWSFTPIKEAQIKLNGDGSLELSGKLIIDNLIPFLSAAGYAFDQEDVQKVFDKVGMIPIDPAIYAKVVPVVTDNTATVSIEAFDFGGFSIDTGKYSGDDILSALVTQVFSQIDGFYARSVTIGEGTLSFDGISPTTITVYPSAVGSE